MSVYRHLQGNQNTTGLQCEMDWPTLALLAVGSIAQLAEENARNTSAN